jgi:hypothetical protein
MLFRRSWTFSFWRSDVDGRCQWEVGDGLREVEATSHRASVADLGRQPDGFFLKRVGENPVGDFLPVGWYSVERRVVMGGRRWTPNAP